MRNAFLILVSFLVATVMCASAQQASPALTLQDCVRLAVSAPSSVSIARQENEIAAREISQARAGLLPQLQLVNGTT